MKREASIVHTDSSGKYAVIKIFEVDKDGNNVEGKPSFFIVIRLPECTAICTKESIEDAIKAIKLIKLEDDESDGEGKQSLSINRSISPGY